MPKKDYSTSTVDGAEGFDKAYNAAFGNSVDYDDCDCSSCEYLDEDCVPDCYPCPYHKEIT